MIKYKFLYVTALLVFWTQPAMAYIDPGSGSAIMSAIIGFFVALGLIIKTYWFKIRSLFHGGKKKAETDSSQLEGEK